MRSKFYIVLNTFISVCTLTAICYGQITITFNAPVHGQSLEGLAFTQIVNNSPEDVKATLVIRVKENAAGDVLTATIPGIPLRRGVNMVDRTSFSRGRFSFANNPYGLTLSQTGRFSEGEYEYCFEIEITDSKSTWQIPFFENCFVQQLQPLTPLLLINPADEDESCNTRPAFLWQLPAPLPPGARSRLILTEVREKQDIAEAINFNMPILNQGNIIGNQILYPPNAPSLREGKKYTWQVTVYTDKSILKKSEIWTYSVKCKGDEPPAGTDSYRELREDIDGNFYVAHKILRFSFHNPYDAGTLLYSITNLSSGGKVDRLPELKMLPGLNKTELDLSEYKAFKQDQEYMLELRLANNRTLRLRFLYKNQ